MVLHQTPVDAIQGAIDLALTWSGFLIAVAARTAASPLPNTGVQTGSVMIMGEEHLRRIAVPDLEGVEVHAPLDPIDVQEELRRVPDPRDGPDGCAGHG